MTAPFSEREHDQVLDTLNSTMAEDPTMSDDDLALALHEVYPEMDEDECHDFIMLARP